MAQNIDNPMESNPNFDKEYFIRETERLDFMDQEDLSDRDFMEYFEERNKIHMYAGDPSTQVRTIEDGT